MHALEKILARHAGLKSVSAGQIVNCRVDIAGINDLYPQAMYSFREMGGKRVRDPENVVIFLDHYAPASSVAQAANQKEFRDFAKAQGIGRLMDVNRGVCHQVLVDEGLSAPGKLIVVTDSHTTMHGALGAFSTGVGATDLAIILATGELWFRVPEIIRINITGTTRPGVCAKDVILYIIGQLGAEHAIYKGVEFSGSVISEMSVSERLALCNMSTEMGAKAAYIKPDSITLKHLESVGASDFTIDETDPDFEYAEDLTFDISGVDPQVSAPFTVDNVFSLREYEGTPVQQCLLGTCTGGRTQDIAKAAEILRGKRIADGVRMLVIPASRGVLLECIEKGYIEDLVRAGCTLVTPGCAACLGTHEGIISSGETCISTSNRNFPGRMGANDARIFLASPAAVAASALTGAIAVPKE